MHHICHVELPVQDLTRAQDFYAGLFGWKMEPSSPDYVMFTPEKAPDGGLQKAGPDAPANIIFYVFVEEITAALARAKGLGATVVRQKTDIPNIGWYGIFQDPEGNAVGLFQAK
jgi:predicted enzyme related to lactoylglutathione lyase